MAQPDNERIMAEVRDLANEARETMTLPVERAANLDRIATIAPIHLGKTHEVIPEKYVMHIHFTICKNCNTQSSDSQFFALTYLRSRATGTRVRHLQRCDTPLFNLPVDRLVVGHHKTPFCAECETISLAHLPPPPCDAQLYDLAEPRTKGAKPKVTKPAPTPPVKLEDLA